MTTTIQISDDVKTKLFHVINRLEKQRGRRVTYNEALRYLLKIRTPIEDREEFLTHLDKYVGSLNPGEGKALLKEQRELDNKRDRRLRNR